MHTYTHMRLNPSAMGRGTMDQTIFKSSHILLDKHLRMDLAGHPSTVTIHVLGIHQYPL